MGSVGAKQSGGGEMPKGAEPEKKQGLNGDSTIQEVQSYYKDSFGINISDNIAKGLGRYTMIEASQQLDKLYAMLPEDLRNSLKYDVTFNVHGNSYASVSLMFSQLNLNKSLFGKGTHDKLKDSYANDVKQHWHPEGTNHADILVHEFGHVIEHAITKKLSGGTFNTIIAWNDNKYSKKIVDEAYNDYKKSGKMPKGMSTKAARQSISGYANSTKKGKIQYHETIAEAVSDVVRNGSKANPYSVHIWNNLKALF